MSASGQNPSFGPPSTRFWLKLESGRLWRRWDGPKRGQERGHGKNVPQARATGAARACISLGSISESRVQDDWTIDFRSGRQWYRVTLPERCYSLSTYRSFKYETSLSELCSTDIITVMEFGPGGGPRGSCGLAPFQPVEFVK